MLTFLMFFYLMDECYDKYQDDDLGMVFKFHFPRNMGRWNAYRTVRVRGLEKAE